MYELVRMIIDGFLMDELAAVTTAFIVIGIGFALLSILTDGESES